MSNRLIPTIILIAYSALLVRLLVFKSVFISIGHLKFNFSGQAAGEANFVPFKTIVPYLVGEKGFVIALFNLGGNIGLFVPFGFLVPFVFQTMTWRKAYILAVLTPLVIEGVQVIGRVGIFDIDDIILNGLGVLIGYGVYRLIRRWEM